MEYDLNKRVVECVLKNIPKNKKPVTYFVNVLNISRESAYRRIRGDIPFTVEELIKLATCLDFSIDTIYEQEKQNQGFFDISKAEKNITDFFLIMLMKYSELHEKISNSKESGVTMAFNTLPPPFYTDFSNLFKFEYYKWIHQDMDTYQRKLFSEIVLSDAVITFQRTMKGNVLHGNDVILILDANIFLNLIKEIQCFYQRRLLTGEELLTLKNDVLHLINQYERIAQSGKYGLSKVQLYLSSLYVNSNTVCYNHDNIVEPIFWIFTINQVIIQNAGFISLQSKWLNSLRRQSVLITQSNEIMQAEFFSQQREYIDRYLSVEG